MHNLKKSIIFNINGVKVGIIGYLTPETKFLADRNNVEYIEEIIALRSEVAVLKNQGINIIIALGHSGFVKDLEIAKKVEDIDLVIGGHSNTFLWNGSSPDAEQIEGPYPTVIKQESGKIVLVVQAYAYTKYLGKLLLNFDSNGEIVKYSGAPILLDQTKPQDPDVLKIINRYSADVHRITEEIVGYSTETLQGTYCRIMECNMGSFITDSIVNYYEKTNTSGITKNRPIAILQGGRIRASIAHPGTPIALTRGDWITVLPFSDHLVIVTMKGSVLLEALEHAVGSWRKVDATGEFLQFSGLKVVYDLSKPPGSRVKKAQAICSECEKEEFHDIGVERQYEVIMPDFLAKTGDGYTMFEGLPTEGLLYNELKCVVDYVSEHSPVSPEVSGRIKILNEQYVYMNAAVNFRISAAVVVILLFLTL